jgi:hypothetical protein
MDDKIKENDELLAEIKEPIADSLQGTATNNIEKVEESIVDEKPLIENSNDESTEFDDKVNFLLAESVDQDEHTQGPQYDFKSFDEGKNKMKDDPNAQPYNQNTEVKRKTSDDVGSVAMILGIIALVCSSLGPLALVGLVLGIIALVKGAKVRKYSTSGMAGWVLGIIAIVFSGVKVFIGLLFITQLFWFAPFYM